MVNRGQGGRRVTRSGRVARGRGVPAPVVTPPRVRRHPRYGDVPLVERTFTDASGRVHRTWHFDPDFCPPLPAGAVRGDVRKQEHASVFDLPRYYFEDLERRCVQCRQEFTFGAKEQKHWYETLRFNFASVAIRCRACRRQRRSDKALHHAVEDAKKKLATTPGDPDGLLTLAEALVMLRERMDRGSMHQAIAAARKARGADGASAGGVADTLYWEARAQELLGRDDKARALFQSFVDRATGKVRRSRVRDAQARLARLG